jgi:Lar family restriction alleviation protein
MTEKLKSCPFCHGTAEIMKHEREDFALYWVICGKCLTGSNYYNTEEEVIAAWNRRANPLQKWDAGSEPPDGFYWFLNDKSQTICLIWNGKAVANKYSDARPVSVYFENGYQLYGPIPEPEVEA